MEFEHAATGELGQKRGPILLQCPRYPKRIFKEWQEFLDVLLPFLERVPGPQYVLEVRNGEWLTPDFLKTLRSAGISLALSDFRGPDGFERKTFPHVGDYLDNPAEIVTGSVAYIRLIGDRWTMEQMTTSWNEQVVPRSSDLQQWAGAILEIAKSSKLDIYAYVNNHYAGHGPETVRQLIRILGLL